MKYSPTQALAALKGVTRKRLYEMMANGELSYEKDNNKRVIDGSELARVFKDSFSPEENKKTFLDTEKKQNDTLEIHIENRLLQQKIEALQERLRDKEQETSKLWQRLDEESAERRKLTMILSDMREKLPEKPTGKRKRFFATLIGKNS